jgi:hypothetical protein
MSNSKKSPAATVLQGLAAGALGNAVFTLHQRLARGGGDGQEPPQDWSDAPEPAQVGQRVVEGVLQKEVPLERAGLLTQVVRSSRPTTPCCRR